MYEVHPSNWPVAIDAIDPRNQFHERALHEARVATDHRESAPAASVAPGAPARPSLARRLRLALAGGPAMASTETCTCPA